MVIYKFGKSLLFHLQMPLELTISHKRAYSKNTEIVYHDQDQLFLLILLLVTCTFQ